MALGHWAKDYLGPKEAGGGSGGGVMVVPIEYNESTGKMEFKRTWKEMHDAVSNGQMVVGALVEDEDIFQCYVYGIAKDSRSKVPVVTFYPSFFNTDPTTATAATENDFPSFTE